MAKETKEHISYKMSRVKNKDSLIERTLRKALWAKGLRYRKNRRDIYGTPDIVFISARVTVFCDSEFWHGYNWEERKKDLKTNQEFWYKKIERNIEHDKEVNQFLTDEGWTVLRFWGKQIMKNTDECVKSIQKACVKY